MRDHAIGVRQSALPESVEDTLSLLAAGDYVAERSLATAVFLSLKLGRPLFLEGEAGVGKTEIAKVLAGVLGATSCGCSAMKVWMSPPPCMNGIIRAR